MISDDEIKAIEQRAEAAQKEVSALCKGKQWRMCVPVEQTDSDITIADSLDDIPRLLAALREARKQLDEAQCVIAGYFDSHNCSAHTVQDTCSNCVTAAVFLASVEVPK